MGIQNDSNLNKSVTTTDVPNGAPSCVRKKVKLLSYRINAPGEMGSREMILVRISAIKTDTKEIETPSP